MPFSEYGWSRPGSPSMRPPTKDEIARLPTSDLIQLLAGGMLLYSDLVHDHVALATKHVADELDRRIPVPSE